MSSRLPGPAQRRSGARTAWLVGTLGIGAILLVWKPALLLAWITPGVPPPGPFG